MSLNVGGLQSALRAALSTTYASSAALSGSTPQQIEAARDGIVATLSGLCGSAMKSYLDAMQDVSGDYCINVSLSACTALFTDLFQFKDYTGANHPALAQAAADARWLAMFPFVFDLLIPPAGNFQDISAISVAPTPLGDIGSAYGTWDEDTWTTVISEAIHDGASSIQVLINYLTTAPGNPPGPPLTAGVL